MYTEQSLKNQVILYHLYNTVNEVCVVLHARVCEQ